jgi:undecaprenyl-diphosphatase
MRKISKWILKGDYKTFSLINNNMNCSFLDKSFSLITHLGGAFITCALPIILMFFGNVKLKRMGFDMALALSLSHVFVRLLKNKFMRLRPYDYLEMVNTHGLFWDDFSFPSGHTTAIFSICTTIAMNMPEYLRLFFVIAIIIGISRIYIGVHYPSDVLIGAMIGFGTAILVHKYLFFTWIQLLYFELRINNYFI